jgi:hypothetical protein
LKPIRLYFPAAMARPNNITKVPPRSYSPDDIAARLAEVAEREAADTRTEAQKFLGEPHPARSALAAKLSRLNPRQ